MLLKTNDHRYGYQVPFIIRDGYRTLAEHEGNSGKCEISVLILKQEGKEAYFM
jgi:hypothetical protein